MDVLTFISKLVEALAWPVIVMSVLVYFRKDFPAIGRSVRKLKVKDVEMEFGASVRELAIETRRAVPEPTDERLRSGAHEESPIAQKLAAIADVSPRAAILEAWLVVEAAAAKALTSDGGQSPRVEAGPRRIQLALRQQGILTPPQEVAFEHLRRIRNQALHLPDIDLSAAAVASYVRSALAIAAYLDDVASMPAPGGE